MPNITKFRPRLAKSEQEPVEHARKKYMLEAVGPPLTQETTMLSRTDRRDIGADYMGRTGSGSGMPRVIKHMRDMLLEDVSQL